MTKQEYGQKKSELKEKRREITEELEKIRLEYISANEPFKIGDRVKTAYGDFGIVRGFDLDWDGNVKPLMWKEKKDGKPSKFKLDVFKVESVSLADNF